MADLDIPANGDTDEIPFKIHPNIRETSFIPTFIRRAAQEQGINKEDIDVRMGDGDQQKVVYVRLSDATQDARDRFFAALRQQSYIAADSPSAVSA